MFHDSDFKTVERLAIYNQITLMSVHSAAVDVGNLKLFSCFICHNGVA